MPPVVRVLAIIGIASVVAYSVFVVGLILPNDFLANIAVAAVSLSSRFFSAEALRVTPEDVMVQSGDSVAFSIAHRGKKDGGSYFLKRSCGADTGAELIQGIVGRIIPCDAPVSLSPKTTEFTVRFVTARTPSEEMCLSLLYVNDDDERAVDVLVTVIGGPDMAPAPNVATAPETKKDSGHTTPSLAEPEAKPADTTTVSPTAITVPAGTKSATGKMPKTAGTKTDRKYQFSGKRDSAATGKPDLAVKILEVGIVNTSTNEFTATTTLRGTDRIAVRFEVRNDGTVKTNSWYFNAALPTRPFYIFHSEGQSSLEPNDRIEYVLGFDSIEKKDGNAFVVNLDPTRSIAESMEDNNIASTTISGVEF